MDKKFIEEFDRKEKSRRHKIQKRKETSKSASKKTKVEETEPDLTSSNYRDRAKERREGLNKDFEHDPDDLKRFVPRSEEKEESKVRVLDDEARRHQEIEDSKYLGGDIKHTHLVKGLDFALLEKVKACQKIEEQKKSEKKEEVHNLNDLGSDSEEEEFRMEAILAASGSGANKHILDIEKLKRGQSTEVINCRTALARRILNVLEEKLPEKSDLFLPGRMTYIVPIDEEYDDTTVTTIVRSKAETQSVDVRPTQEAEIAMDYLINMLKKIRQGEHTASDGKKSKSWKDDGMSLAGYDY